MARSEESESVPEAAERGDGDPGSRPDRVKRRRLAERAKLLRREAVALAYALRDPRVPWYSRLLILLTVAYIVSPLDLIPDFIPVLGLIDDLVIVPLGIYLSLKTIPKQVLADCRKKAEGAVGDRRLRRLGLLLVVALWGLFALLVALFVTGVFRL